MAPTITPFFNLPTDLAAKANGLHEERVLGIRQNHTFHTHWKTLEDQTMSFSSMMDVFANNIPLVRQTGFLSAEECKLMLDIVKTHEIGDYDTDNVWPRVGYVGIAQYDHTHDKDTYFKGVKEAGSLQTRWKEEIGIDIIQRVIDLLHKITGMPVRRAMEGDREYFAGVVRAIDSGIQIHSDYAPYEGANWEIGRIAAQLSWNILLNNVRGGDTFVYDREWQAPQDDLAWRKEFPKYAYDPRIVEGRALKVMRAIPGDLTFFNPRNFHEVRACDIDKGKPTPIRFTVSSFVGYLPAQGSEPATLVVWS